MVKRLTKAVTYVRLSETRIAEIQDLVASWPYETKAFMRARLNQYKPRSGFVNALLEATLTFFMDSPEKHFDILKDPDILTDWQRRLQISGQTNPQDAWNKILEKEVSARDYDYLLSLLNEDLTDVHVPWELRLVFEKVYRAHIRKEYLSDPTLPKAPLILVTGSSGSGKSATVSHAIDTVIFGDQVLPEVDLEQKKEELLAGEPFWKSIEEIDPTLAMEISRRKRLKLYKRLSRVPLLRRLLKKRISQNLSDLEEQSLPVDYSMVTPNDYQTALAGEPGNYFKKALGDPRRTAIRHIEEAHSAFGKTEGSQSGVERQQRSLIDTANIVIDEIISGRRDCLLIATTDQPERFNAAIYRRFVEKGKIIDISEFWQSPENLKEVVRLELVRLDFHVGADPEHTCPAACRCIAPSELEAAVEKIYAIFQERSLKITPAYVRKLVHSIVEIRADFAAAFLDDSLLVRSAFELVARNSYGDLYDRVVGNMDRKVKWESYVGEIKDMFSEMSNNCLYYSVSEEKGVVLNGPPGSGKTFLVRTWLSENADVHDIATSPSALQDPANPIDGAVDNLEKVYDIAKMIAPSVVFFDEGDALAPRRSASGGAPSDKLTNKFLNIIDGEIPLNRVFTVLTTNRLDILDPALIRSKRLKVLEVSGHLGNDDIAEIVAQTLKGIPLAEGLDIKTIMESAQGLCNTPADYTAFVEKARSLRNTEYEVLSRFRALEGATVENRAAFARSNFKTLVGILDAAGAPKEIRRKIKENPAGLVDFYDEILALVKTITELSQYPMMPSHLSSARQAISQSPTKKGSVQLDEFLEAELSQEPQVGFIIGVGANDISGMLLPIATSLTYNVGYDKVIVTGAVSSSAPAAAEMEMAVKMTQQSAQEALTMVENYLQELDPKVSMAKLLGEFLTNHTIHHQLLSASYSVGGPSAGYALALNTLSTLLQIPILNDFGITGAPWTKGVKRGEVGGSVIIGGHRKKTEKVLLHLRRMYMPLQNYKDLQLEFLAGYWAKGKDALGVTHFGDLVPEVVWIDAEQERLVQNLIDLRIHYKLGKYRGKTVQTDIKENILRTKADLKGRVDKEIVRRLQAIRAYLRDPMRDPHVSMEEIFLYSDRRALRLIQPLRRFLKKQQERFRGEEP